MIDPDVMLFIAIKYLIIAAFEKLLHDKKVSEDVKSQLRSQLPLVSLILALSVERRCI